MTHNRDKMECPAGHPYTQENTRNYGGGRYCRRCDVARKNGKARYWKNRRWVNEYKLARGCADCGYSDHPDALEFDHVRGEKRWNIGSHLHSGRPTLEREIAKCDVVCANCHRIRTAARRLAD